MTRKLHWIRLLSQSLAMIFLLPALAWADHCGSLTDCWGTAAAAGAAAAGAAAVAAVAALFGSVTGDTQNPDPPPAESGDEPEEDPCYH